MGEPTAVDPATLRALAADVLDLGLSGPWAWFGNTKHDPPHLATTHSGRRFVVRTAEQITVFDRDEEGMPTGTREAEPDEIQDQVDGFEFRAQLAFPHRSDGDTFPVMTRADTLGVFAVAPDVTDPDDPRVYRHDICDVANPVARWLAAVDPTTVLALLDRIDELETQAGRGTV